MIKECPLGYLECAESTECAEYIHHYCSGFKIMECWCNLKSTILVYMILNGKGGLTGGILYMNGYSLVPFILNKSLQNRGFGVFGVQAK